MEQRLSSGGYDEALPEVELDPGLDEFLEGVEEFLGQEERYVGHWLFMNNICCSGSMNAASFRSWSQNYMEKLVVLVKQHCLHLLGHHPLLLLHHLLLQHHCVHQLGRFDVCSSNKIAPIIHCFQIDDDVDMFASSPELKR